MRAAQQDRAIAINPLADVLGRRNAIIAWRCGKMMFRAPAGWVPALTTVLMLADVPAALAHRQPLPLALWGDFGRAARCQRVLGSAATQCALEVWTVRRTCIEAQLAGAGCDADATTSAVTTARQRALDKIDHTCSAVNLVTLQFLGTTDALADLTSGCRQLETAFVSGTYGPALSDAAVVSVDDQTRVCLRPPRSPASASCASWRARIACSSIGSRANS